MTFQPCSSQLIWEALPECGGSKWFKMVQNICAQVPNRGKLRTVPNKGTIGSSAPTSRCRGFVPRLNSGWKPTPDVGIRKQLLNNFSTSLGWIFGVNQRHSVFNCFHMFSIHPPQAFRNVSTCTEV
eukprot:s7073_g2.t1